MSARARSGTEWYRQVQFIAGVAMPEDAVREYGTTVNGMWASPEAMTAQDVAQAHAEGRRVLFSVPMIALTPAVYDAPENRYLLDERCADIDGAPAIVPWYYWEDRPVHSMCIYSPVFRGYLMDRCRIGIDAGMDVVNLDEINTSIGLIGRAAGNSGFCPSCLERFRAGGGGTPHADDPTLRRMLAEDDELFARYRRFHELEAFEVVRSFIDELHAYAADRNPGFAVTANLAYLGNNVITHGPLWGPMWGEYVDFVMMENAYRVQRDGPHELLPRGKFAAWYRLAASFSSRAPAWICPDIRVPRQLAGQQRTRYHELMFLEAYANGGRYAYYWWPGVDVETRMAATAPQELKPLIRFVDSHRDLYEGLTTANELAVLYLDSSIGRKPEAHDRFLALAQALAEGGYQFDVIYGGDGDYSPDALEADALGRHRAILVPEAEQLTPAQAHALTAHAGETGGALVVFSPSPLAGDLVREADGAVLSAFWRDYRDEDRERILAHVAGFPASRVRCSDPAVGAVRYRAAERHVVHLLNYAYDEARDAVSPASALRVTVPWHGAPPVACTLVGLEGEQAAECEAGDGVVTFEVPELELFAVAVISERP